MKIKTVLSALILLLTVNIYSQSKILPPDSGIYAGAFPDMGSTEDSVTKYRISEYINLTGHIPMWICFSNNWFNEIKFPIKAVNTISDFKAIPYIRLMPRHDWTMGRRDPVYDLDKIIDGDFDDNLIQWAEDAKKYRKPLLVEFAPEMNGSWFPWSGLFNGKKRGADKYIKAHRYIVDLMKDEGATNITWMFHINAISDPKLNWNEMRDYYPGDNYIDWIGMSIYGSQKPGSDFTDFIKVFQSAYWEMEKISLTKPLAIAEFGVIEDPPKGNKSKWLREAFETILSGFYPRIKAISYWHSLFDNEDGSISNMRLDSTPDVLAVYKEFISKDVFKQTIKISGKNKKQK